MAELPVGTVTFLFSDVEGSTRHWEQDPNGMRRALELHDQLLRGAVVSNRGHVVKTTGDGVHAVFGEAEDALAAALAAQRELGTTAWPSEPLLVRIGLHTGSAQVRDGDYYGPVLNRAARLMAVGHGGQILCSQATADLLRDATAADTRLLDLGEHRLRDLGRPERIYQVTHPDLRAEFPPPQSLQRYRTNLPTQPSVFVGRDDELTRVAAALHESCLVTLTGVGGVGKTRLGVQAAAEALPGFEDGAWLVELSSVTDADAIDATVASSFGVGPPPGGSVRAGLLEYLRDRHLLLMLDNCEHLVAPVAELAEAILAVCPRVHLLATSREGLAASGERLVAVPPLGVPDGETLDEVGAADAVRLFLERAQAVDGSFRLTDANAAVLAQLVRRLDGIPLAIELAAARVQSMAPADILGHLDQRFRLLTGGRRTALTRQQTLRGAIDWSYELLDERARALFCRLGAFVGGFDLRAVEHVAVGDPLDALDMAELVPALVERSLVVADTTRTPARYRLLETLRDYTVDRLTERGEFDAVAHRHADYFVAFAHQAGVGLRGAEEVAWTDRLEEEIDNVRVAVRWLVDGGAVDEAMQVVLDLAEFGTRLAAPLGALAADVAAMSGAEQHPLRPVAMASAAWHMHQLGDAVAALDLARAAVDAAGPLASPARCRALSALVGVAALDGETDLALRFTRELRVQAEALGDRWEELQALAVLSGMGGVNPVPGESRGAAERATTIARELGSPTYLAFTLLGLANSLLQDQPVEARAQLEAAYRAALAARNDYARAVILLSLASVTFALGDQLLAARQCYWAAVCANRTGHRGHLDSYLYAFALTAQCLGDDDTALVLDAWTGRAAAGLMTVHPMWRELEPRLAERRSDQSAEQRDQIAARAAALDVTTALRMARTSLEAMGAPVDDQAPDDFGAPVVPPASSTA